MKPLIVILTATSITFLKAFPLYYTFQFNNQRTLSCDRATRWKLSAFSINGKNLDDYLYELSESIIDKRNDLLYDLRQTKLARNSRSFKNFIEETNITNALGEATEDIKNIFSLNSNKNKRQEELEEEEFYLYSDDYFDENGIESNVFYRDEMKQLGGAAGGAYNGRYLNNQDVRQLANRNQRSGRGSYNNRQQTTRNTHNNNRQYLNNGRQGNDGNYYQGSAKRNQARPKISGDGLFFAQPAYASSSSSSSSLSRDRNNNRSNLRIQPQTMNRFQPQTSSQRFQPQTSSQRFQPQTSSQRFQPQTSSQRFQPQRPAQFQPEASRIQSQRPAYSQPQTTSRSFQQSSSSTRFQPQRSSTQFQPQNTQRFQPQRSSTQFQPQSSSRILQRQATNVHNNIQQSRQQQQQRERQNYYNQIRNKYSTQGKTKKYLPKELAPSIRKAFVELCTKPSGVLLQSELLQIGYRHEYKGNYGRVSIFFGNLYSLLPLQNLRVSIQDTDRLEFDSEPGTTLGILQTTGCDVQVGEQALLNFRVDASGPFGDAPTIRIMFDTVYGSEAYDYTLTLPIVPTKFLKPVSLKPRQFLQIWKSLEGIESEELVEFGSNVLVNDSYMRRMARVLTDTLNFSWCQGCDPTKWTISVAANWPRDSVGGLFDLGCMIRIEAFPSAGAFRITTRASDTSCAVGVKNIALGAFNLNGLI